jgi:hypothetical protein
MTVWRDGAALDAMRAGGAAFDHAVQGCRRGAVGDDLRGRRLAVIAVPRGSVRTVNSGAGEGGPWCWFDPDGVSGSVEPRRVWDLRVISPPLAARD